MMDINFVKETAESCVRMAQTLLIRDGALTPVAISIRSEGKSFPTELPIENEKDKAEFAEKLWELSLTCEGMAVIIDSFVKDTAVMIPGVTISAPDRSLEGDPEASEAIVCFAYVKGKTSIRQVLYKRETPTSIPIFFDQGWVDVDTKNEQADDRLSNPFKN